MSNKNRPEKIERSQWILMMKQFIIAFIMSIGFQLKHKDHCNGGFFLTKHSHYIRVRLKGIPIWRIQCTKCKAVFTVLPHFILRYRKMSPVEAEKAPLATSSGLSLEIYSMILNISPKAIYRLVCAIGKTCLVTLLTLCGRALPEYFLADEKHSYCLSGKVYFPTIVTGRIIWLLSYNKDKSAATFQQVYKKFKEAALTYDASYRVKGILTDGFGSTIKSLKNLFPEARIGNCMLHAAKKVIGKLTSISSSMRLSLSYKFYEIFQQSREKKGLRIFSFAQKLRRFVEEVAKVAGSANAQRIKQWIKEKKKGWNNLIEDTNIPPTSTFLDQAHNSIDRKLFMMKGFHHKKGSQEDYQNGLAILYNMIPYQRRAKNVGMCGIEVEGGRLPSKDWFLGLQILTSGGYN